MGELSLGKREDRRAVNQIGSESCNENGFMFLWGVINKFCVKGARVVLH